MAQKNEAPALVLALLVTVGLIAGGVWWLTQRSGLNLGGSTSANSGGPVNASGSGTTAGSAAQSTQPDAKSFASVQNVPSGLFNYGGSTTWAPIRGQVDPEIQKAWSGFQLRYTQPASGTPGSTTGIQMLLEGQLSLAQSSRALKPEETQAAQQRGFSLKAVPVALEGIAIAAHPNLNIPGLTIDQLKGIYTGQITNWSQVGGPNLPIVPYSRQLSESGTVEFFSENILAGGNFGSTVKFISTTTQAIQAVASNPGGIYYASAAEIVSQCGIEPLAVGRDSSSGMVPPYQPPLVPASQCPGQRNQINTQALLSGQYPLTRRLFVIIKQDGQTDQRAGEAYANLLLTEQGQALLSKAGFVRIH